MYEQEYYRKHIVRKFDYAILILITRVVVRRKPHLIVIRNTRVLSNPIFQSSTSQ